MKVSENLIHESAEIHPTVEIGINSRVWHFAQIRENASIGSDCVLSRGVYIGPGVLIGNSVKLQNYSLIYQPTVIEDYVFVGPGAIITNDLLPRSTDDVGNLKDADDWNSKGVRLKKGASIGANAVVLDGITVGEWAMVGASALVSQSVPDYGLVVGNPARLVGWVGRHGFKLLKEQKYWVCPKTGTKYLEKDGILSPVEKKSPGDI